MAATKVLLIKLGFSETLDQEIGRMVSLGDVLRSTPILWALRERFPEAQISWLVDPSAEPLLVGNPLINRLLVADNFTPFQLIREKFDCLLNLEKVAGVCALADMINAWMKYGFRFNSETGSYEAYERGLNFIDYIAAKQKNGQVPYFWQRALIEMLGVTWKEQPYVLGYQPKSDLTYDVGLNFLVGSKWPSKKMADLNWQKLFAELSAKGYSVSWQQGLSNLYEYMDWLHSCRVIVTQDSLGLHLAIALRRPFVGLFGATSTDEIFTYGMGDCINAETNCSHKPCYQPHCITGEECINKIEIPDIVAKVERHLTSGFNRDNVTKTRLITQVYEER